MVPKLKPAFVDIEFVGTDVVCKKLRLSRIHASLVTDGPTFHISRGSLLHNGIAYVDMAREEPVSIKILRPDDQTRQLDIGGEAIDIGLYTVVHVPAPYFGIEPLKDGTVRLTHSSSLLDELSRVSEIRITPHQGV